MTQFDPTKPFERVVREPSAQDLLDALGAHDPVPQPQPQPQAYEPEGNRISRAIGEFTDQRLFPGVAGDAVQVAGGIAETIAADPVQTLILDPLYAPARFAENYNEATASLVRGEFEEAGRHGLDALTAAGETALLFAGPAGAVGGKAANAAATGRRRVSPVSESRPAGNNATRQFMDDAARTGVDPTLPEAFPRTFGGMARTLSDNFAGGATIRKGRERTMRQTQEAADRMASLFSDAGYLRAGQSARDGARGQLMRPRLRSEVVNAPFMTFKEKSRAIYDRAFAQVDMSAEYAPVATRNALAGVKSRFDDRELLWLFGPARTESLDHIVMRRNPPSIHTLRELRTSVRRMRDAPAPGMADADDVLGRIESALSEDIRNAVRQTAGPRQERQLRVADRFYRSNVTAMRKALTAFRGDGLTDMQVYDALYAAAKGTEPDIRRLRALRRALTPQQMDDVSAGVLRRMGEAGDGQPGKTGVFSAETFATEWRNMRPEAKAVLFNRARRPEVRRNLDALARVIQRQVELGRVAGGKSADSTMQTIGTWVGLGAEPVATLTAIVGANAMGRLMMSPAFTTAVLKLQLDAPRIAAQGAVSARDISGILGAIAVAENSDQAIAPYLEEVRRALDASSDTVSQRETQEAQ